MHTCRACGKQFELAAMSKSKARLCKACYSLYMRRYYAERPEKKAAHKILRETWIQEHKKRHGYLVRRAAVARNYGITIAQAKDELRKQGWKCAICARPLTGRYKPKIDHSHTTGKFRGILCGPCNTAIGLLQDSAEILDAAKAYVSSR